MYVVYEAEPGWFYKEFPYLNDEAIEEIRDREAEWAAVAIISDLAQLYDDFDPLVTAHCMVDAKDANSV